MSVHRTRYAHCRYCGAGYEVDTSMVDLFWDFCSDCKQRFTAVQLDEIRRSGGK